jgi:hypothetical protein
MTRPQSVDGWRRRAEELAEECRRLDAANRELRERLRQVEELHAGASETVWAYGSLGRYYLRFPVDR